MDTLVFITSPVTEISIPASVTDIDLSDAMHNVDGCFKQCTGLFTGCSSLKRIDVNENNPKYSSDDGVLYNKDRTIMLCFPPGREGKFEIPYGVTELGYYWYSAFNGSKITSVTIPTSVKKLGGFGKCKNLRNIVIPDSVTDIGEGFKGCDSLTDLILPTSVARAGECPFSSTLRNLTILNKTFDFAIGDTGVAKTTTIHGYSGSTAEEFAKKNGNPFVALDGAGTNTAEKPVIKVSKIKISGDSKRIAAGKKVKLTAAVSPSNAANKGVTWESGNKKVATVNSSGVVSMKKGSGGKKVTITVTAKDGSGKKASYTIQSMKGAVKSIKISGKTSVKAGKTIKLKAKVTAQKKANKTVRWTSSNAKYAKVSNSGKVTALKAGKGKKVKITAMATDGSGKKKSVRIKIK